MNGPSPQWGRRSACALPWADRARAPADSAAPHRAGIWSVRPQQPHRGPPHTPPHARRSAATHSRRQVSAHHRRSGACFLGSRYVSRTVGSPHGSCCRGLAGSPTLAILSLVSASIGIEALSLVGVESGRGVGRDRTRRHGCRRCPAERCRGTEHRSSVSKRGRR